MKRASGEAVGIGQGTAFTTTSARIAPPARGPFLEVTRSVTTALPISIKRLLFGGFISELLTSRA